MQKAKKKKSNLIWIILALAVVFLIGVGICAYPFVSMWLADKEQKTVVYDAQVAMEQTNTEDMAAMREEAELYNESLSGLNDVINSDGEVYVPSEDNYNDCLNFANGIMGYVEIPKLKVTLPIYHGTTDEVLSKGAGHLYGSSLPIGGPGTHAVLVSHSGLSTATLFTHLDNLEDGDLFYIHVLDSILAYKVDDKQIVLPSEIDNLIVTPGEDHVTLVTCYPVTVNTHRLLVQGTRSPEDDIKTEPGVITAPTESPAPSAETEERDFAYERKFNTQVMVFAICCVAFLVFAGVAVAVSGRRKKK